VPDIKGDAGINDDEREMVYLKFLRIYLQPIFYHASSESDLSVFPLTYLMDTLLVPLFIYSDNMKTVIQRYDVLDSYNYQFEILHGRLTTLLGKQFDF